MLMKSVLQYSNEKGWVLCANIRAGVRQFQGLTLLYFGFEMLHFSSVVLESVSSQAECSHISGNRFPPASQPPGTSLFNI